MEFIRTNCSLKYTVFYLGTKTSSSSDSQTCITCFFPPGLFTGEGVGGGVISMLQKERKVRKGQRKAKRVKLHFSIILILILINLSRGMFQSGIRDRPLLRLMRM